MSSPALAALAGIRHLILVGADDPVAFFAYPDMPGRFAPPEAKVTTLTAPGEDSADALARLADRLAAPRIAPPTAPRPPPASGAITQATVGQTLAALLPENAVVVEEGVTFGFGLYAPMADAAPHDFLRLVGGAIGDGLPLATGAAVGAPGRRVIGLQADGSALYTCRRCGRRPASASTSPPSSSPTAATPSSTASSPRSARRPARPRAPSSTSAIPTSTGSASPTASASRRRAPRRWSPSPTSSPTPIRRPGPFLIELVIP